MKSLGRKSAVAIISTLIITITAISVGKIVADRNSVNYADKDYVAVLNVNQGDSILIYSNGYSALIDTGTEMYSRRLLAKLHKYGINELDALIISHSHEDHMGGAEYLLENINIKNVVIPFFKEDENVSEFTSALKNSNAEIYNAVCGTVINIGDFELTVLYADNSDNDINNRSLVIMADMENKKFLFTGDAEKETEKALISSGINFDCDVLKVGHHGSSTSSTSEFLSIATPQYSAISVGDNNKYGLPSSEITDRLENCGSEVLCTDESGDIVFFVENGDVTVLEEIS